MVPPLVFYQLGLVALVCVFLLLCGLWPNDAASPHQPLVPTKPSRRKRSKEPQPFARLTQRPPRALCERDATHAPQPPPAPPEPMPPTPRRPRTVDTSRHFCPHPECDYRGWLGLHNLRANGHPSGGPWRQFHCTACQGYFLETHGTIFHGKQAAVELNAGDGTTRRASDHPDVSNRLHPTVSERWLQRTSDCHPGAFWLLDSP